MTAATLAGPPSVTIDPARPAAAPGEESSRGAAYGFLAHAAWGLFPLYFHALQPAGAWERHQQHA